MLERALIVLALALAVVVVVLVARAVVARQTAGRLGVALDLPLADASAPTLLYFYGPGCPTCATQRRAVDHLAAEHRASRGPLNVISIDAAEQRDLADWAGVLTVPSTALLDPARRLRAVNHGFQPAHALAVQLEQIAS